MEGAAKQGGDTMKFQMENIEKATGLGVGDARNTRKMLDEMEQSILLQLEAAKKNQASADIRKAEAVDEGD